MALLTAGYWPTTYWAKDYWTDDYWPDYSFVAITLAVKKLLLLGVKR